MNTPLHRAFRAALCSLYLLCGAAGAAGGGANWLSASDAAGITVRWTEFAKERDVSRMQKQERVLRGTIEDYLRASPHVKVLAKIPGGVVVTSPRAPNSAWVMVQIRSIQGNDLVLGPDMLPLLVRSANDVQNWIYPEIKLPFDENKNYAAYYIDRSNRIDTFVIYERRTPAEDMPVAVIYTPREVPEPKLVTESQNDRERVLRGLKHMIPGYSDFESFMRGLAWNRDDPDEIFWQVLAAGISIVALIAILLWVGLKSARKQRDRARHS